jgi:hypothetical protein
LIEGNLSPLANTLEPEVVGLAEAGASSFFSSSDSSGMVSVVVLLCDLPFVFDCELVVVALAFESGATSVFAFFEVVDFEASVSPSPDRCMVSISHLQSPLLSLHRTWYISPPLVQIDQGRTFLLSSSFRGVSPAILADRRELGGAGFSSLPLAAAVREDGASAPESAFLDLGGILSDLYVCLYGCLVI